MGGIGKTTLARIVYERISSQFEMCCFLSNIREVSEREDPVHAQRHLLSHLNISNEVIMNKHEGKAILRNLFCSKKVLLVLDDVTHMSQLENMAESPKWFGMGSRVIITTRDMHLLRSLGVHGIYQLETMQKDESLQLFSRKAFRKDYAESNYLMLSESVVKYAGGLPLALHVLGSFLCGRSVPEWEDALDRLKEIPEDNIIQKLKISYDALNYQEKAIFLDIACFFNGWMKYEVTQILRNCDLHPTIGINVLIEKALLIEKKNMYGKCILEMHDLLQELGRNIVFQESLDNAGRRSRLWNIEDINEILKDNAGSNAIHAIVTLSHAEVEVHPEVFSKMRNLRLLYLDCGLKHPIDFKCLSNALKVIVWLHCPLEALPLEIPLHKLVDIQMPYSNIKQLWNGVKFMKNLKHIDMSYSKDLTETPNFSGVPNLENLILEWCISLIVVHPSLGELKKLVEVDLHGCIRLEILPRKLEMNSLIKLDLGYCYEISMLPEFGECMKKLSLLDASCTAITKLPESLGFLTGLQDLGLSGCENIDLHPFTVKKLLGFNLMSLTELNLSNCGISDGSIPDDFGGLTSLFALDLGRNDFVNLPIGCFCNLHRLHYLFLNDCKRLKSLPKLPPRLIRLDAFSCDALEPLSDRQLWNVVSSLDHEYRHQTKYTNSLIQHDELEYLPQRDFLTIITALEVPSWFQNKDYVSSYDYSGEFVLMVDIPQYFRASEWSGLAVCLNIQSFLMSESVYISWSSKAPEDDNYICKDWSHVIGNGLKQGHHLCLMLLHLNDKTCWQHLRGDDSCLHIKLSLRCALLEDLVIVGCGWRVLCKDEMKEWGSFNDFSKSTKAEAGASKVCLPDSVIHRTIKNFQGEFGIPVEAVRQAHFTHFKEWHGREKINS